MITWKPCHGGGCVQTGTDEHGNIWVRNSKPGFGFGGMAVFTQAEWDEHLDSIRREERQRIRDAVSPAICREYADLLDFDEYPNGAALLRKFADLLDGAGDE